MNKVQAEQSARIIERVFKFEEAVDPRTIAELFKIIASLYVFREDEEDA